MHCLKFWREGRDIYHAHLTWGLCRWWTEFRRFVVSEILGGRRFTADGLAQFKNRIQTLTGSQIILLSTAIWQDLALALAGLERSHHVSLGIYYGFQSSFFLIFSTSFFPVTGRDGRPIPGCQGRCF